MRRLAVAFAAVPLLAGCSAPLYADLDIPEVRITLPQQSFPTLNPAPSDLCAATAGCVAVPLSYDVGADVPGLDQKNISVDLRVTEVALSVTAGGTGNLAGVKKIAVTLLDGPGATAGTVLASYAAPASPGAPTSISVSGNPSVNLGPYLQSGKLPVRVEMTYDPASPPPDVVADVTLTFSLVLHVNWGGYL